MKRLLKVQFVALCVVIGVILTTSVVGLSSGAAPPAPDPQKQVVVAVTTQFAAAAIPITARVGDQFTLTLPSSPGTGYSWQMLNQPDAKVLKKTDSGYNEPEKPMPGKPGTETWSFKAVGKGKQRIEMVYLRPWEKGVTPERKQVFEVNVL